MPTYNYKLYTQNNENTPPAPVFSGSFITDINNSVTEFYQIGNSMNILSPANTTPPQYNTPDVNFNQNASPKIFGTIYNVTANTPDPNDPSSNYYYRLDNDGSNSNVTYINFMFSIQYYAFITDENTPCFSKGTKILSLTSQLKEEYRLVQDLMIGDFVKSYLHGYRKVSKIINGSFVNNTNDEGVANCMYRMTKTEDNALIDDLILTRNHGVLVEKLTENEDKKVDKNSIPVIDNLLSIITADCDKFEKVMDTNVYKYYHFSLETDGDEDRRFGVYANGILVEVPSNNMMDNALNVKHLDF